MKFKKVYIEITNVCNLNCKFCGLTDRKKEFMTIENFKVVLEKIKGYTQFIYLHVMGEPLLHPELKQMIEIAVQEKFNVQLTTNGYLISVLEEIEGIRQVNISLQAYNKEYGKSLEEYMRNLFRVGDKLSKKGTYVNFRSWVKNSETKKIIELLNKRYQVLINSTEKTKKLKDHIFYSKENEFLWPSRVEKGSIQGFCPALTTQIGVLVDGTVVPCCLDNNGLISLGNIFKDDLKEIIKSSKYQELLKSFQSNQRIYELCQKCTFYQNKR